MNRLISIIFFCFATAIVLFAYSGTTHAKKRCKPFLEKLHAVQSQQRNGYSVKRGESLRTKEEKARDKWWECEHMSLAKFKAKNGGSKNKVKKKQTKYVDNMNFQAKKKPLILTYKAKNTFNQDSPIVIKSKYQGQKKVAWSQFYQRPSECISPKSLSVFAACNENKLHQQSKFDVEYTK
jgi:hypothetical protein